MRISFRRTRGPRHPPKKHGIVFLSSRDLGRSTRSPPREPTTTLHEPLKHLIAINLQLLIKGTPGGFFLVDYYLFGFLCSKNIC